MGIESLYADGIEASIQRDLANPRQEAPPSFRIGSFLSAGIKGLPAAAHEVAGSILDFTNGVDLQYAAERAARARRLGQPAHDTFVMPDGAEQRALAKDYVPDPLTSHVSDQVLFGLTRVGAKVAAASSTGNIPVAGSLLFAEGANTGYRTSIEKGIDEKTAMRLAAVEGAGQAAALLPVVGPGVKSTIALAAAAGPGTFMAQEALSKKVLEQAGYHDEASRHDPFDPLGLSLSIALPAIVGGAHIASFSRPRPAPIGPLKTDTDVRAAAELTPAEQQLSDAYERSAANLRELAAAVAAEKNPANKALLQSELQKQQAAAASHLEATVIERGGVDPDVVDAARVRVTDDALRRSMPDHPDAPSEVMRAGDAIAAGEFPTVKPMKVDYSTMFNDLEPKYEVPAASQATMRMTPSGLPDIRTDSIHLTDAHPVERFEAILDPGEQIVRFLIRTPDGKPKGYTDLMIRDGQVVSLYDIETTQGLRGQGVGAKVVEAITSLDPDRKLDISNIVDDAVPFWEKVGVLVNDGNRSPTLDWHQFAESPSGRNRGAPRRSQGVGGQHEGLDAGAAGGDRSAPQGGEARELTAEEAEQFGFGPRDAGGNALPAADHVETSAKPATSPAGEPAAAVTTQRAQRVAEEFPDLQVRLPGSEQTLTVAEALKVATDEHTFDLGENDLLKAAFECALSFGA